MATKELLKYGTYMTANRWCSVDAHFTVLSIWHLLSSTVVFIMIWTYWKSFCQIKTWPCDKAECSNIVAMFTHTLLTFVSLAKSFIMPAIHLFLNRYLQASAHHSHIIYLSWNHSVKIHTEAGETLTHSVLLCLHCLVPSRFDCIDCHEHLFSMSVMARLHVTCPGPGNTRFM